MMYTCLIQQNRSAILEALNNWGKTLRMRGGRRSCWPHFEEAETIWTQYRHNTLGIISDMVYLEARCLRQARRPSSGGDGPEGGADLPPDPQQRPGVQRRRGARRLLHLGEQQRALRGAEPLYGRPLRLRPLHLPRPGDDGGDRPGPHDAGPAADAATIPTESFDFHCRRNEFSRWLRAQSLYTIADKIKDLQIDTHGTAEEVQEQLIQIIRTTGQRTRGVIASSVPELRRDPLLQPDREWLARRQGTRPRLHRHGPALGQDSQKYPSVYLSIPRTVVPPPTSSPASLKRTTSRRSRPVI